MQAVSSHPCRLAFCALLLTLAEPSTLRAQATAGKAATPSLPVKDLPVTSQDTQRYTGMYSIKLQGPSARSMSLRIFEEKGALLGQIDANAPTRMLYQGNGAFRPEAAQAFLVTFTLKSGRATAVSMISPEGKMDGLRVESGRSRSENAQADPTSSGPLCDELARLDSLLFDAFFVKVRHAEDDLIFH